MKKILYSLLAISSLSIMQSCGDFLNNPPKGMTIPSRTEDYQKLIASGGMMTQTSTTNLEYLTDNVHLLNADASATRYSYVGKEQSLQNIYSFAPGDIEAPGTEDWNWTAFYSRIFTWNVVVNNVMDSKGGTTAQKRALKAEALFGRAYEFFLLVNTYGRHYTAATAATDYGIPLVLSEDINTKVRRSTVQEAYDKILTDLKEAEADLPASATFKNHPDQCALMSFYAKIYLFMGEYATALEYADKALAMNNKLLNLNDYVLQIGTTWDRLTLKTDSKVRYPDIDHPENIYVRYGADQIQGNVMLSASARDVFKQDIAIDTMDLRKYYFTSEDSVSFGKKPDFFPGDCCYALYSNANVGFSTADIMLIAAECEARVGSKDKAMEHINKLRATRFTDLATADQIKLTATDKTDALTKVLRERRRETMMLGSRLFDLKRLNLDPATAVTYKHSADGGEWTMTPNSNLYIFPINNVIMGYNPDMPQYDRK